MLRVQEVSTAPWRGYWVLTYEKWHRDAANRTS
jgi:hypothetical protein